MLKLNSITVLMGVVGSFFSFIFGGWDTLMIYLVMFMVLDFFTGMIRSAIHKQITTKVSYIGLAKKVGILVIVAVSHGLDQLLMTVETSIFNMEFPAIRTLVIWGYIINEVTSILENIKQLGVPIPSILEKVLSVIKDDYERQETLSNLNKKQNK